MNDNELLFKPFHTFGDYIIVEFLGMGRSVVYKAIPLQKWFKPLNYIALGVYHTPLYYWVIFFIVIIIVAFCVLISPIFTPTMMIRTTIVVPLGCVVLVRLFLIRLCINRKAVAIKIPFPQDDNTVCLLNREVVALSKMQYKICSVEKFSVKKLGKKLSCIVMDYIPHKDLSDIIKKKLSIKEIVKYAIGICEALSLIHNEGMTHRDIKPSNIKIDSLANAYIFDLEIAKIKDKISITSRDVVVGTLQYMSPEQTYSNPSLNYRSDIYSLGITLFEMIEGQVPFDSTASDYDEYKKEIMRKHREEEPPPIIRSDCPESLKEVVFTALKKDREERYSSAQEMADALTAVLESLNN